ncbi:MAG: hypothetical protein FWC91_08450 [Defluviitaleaceae bacterium]|nr:hypothetical protein [Defluviitaleaceae bacterium]
MNKAFVKNLHPFYAPDDGDGDDFFDINQLLFGDSTDVPAPSGSSSDLATKSNLEIDTLNGDDLDAALAALLAADGSDSPDDIDNPDDNIDSTMDFDANAGSAPTPSVSEPQTESGGADIDALLASLNGGDDTQSISGTAPPPAPPRPAPLPLPTGSNTDDAIAQLLAMDEREDSSFDVNRSKATAPRVAVYDEEGVGDWSEFHYDPYADVDDARVPGEKLRESARMASRRKKTLGSRIMEMPTGTFLIASGLILVVILGLGAGAIFGIDRVNAARMEQMVATAHLTPIEQPLNVANNSHFISVGMLEELAGQEFLLRRITIGQRGTVFHFDDVFNPDEYSIMLTDQDGNFFGRIRQDIVYGSNRRGTTLQFSPLRNTTRELTLYIQDRNSNEKISYEFLLEGGPGFPAASYVNNFVPLFDGESGLENQIMIANAVFSNTSSEIVYLIQEDPSGRTVAFEREGIVLRDGSRRLEPNRPTPVEFTFPTQNLILGRATYGPMLNLVSTARIDFGDMFASAPMPSHNIDISALFRDTPEDVQIVQVGDYTLVLERMGVRGTLVILVMHGLDEDGQRMQTELDIDLIIETDSGSITISGQNHSMGQGTDIVFDATGRGITTINPNHVRLDINAFNVLATDVSVPLHLDQQSLRPSQNRITVESSIRAAFASRLSYRLENISFSSIRGFSFDVLYNRATMRHYTPISLPEGTIALYDIQILAGAFYGDDLFLAIVEEELAINENGTITTLHTTHQIVSQLIEGQWVIIENRILV